MFNQINKNQNKQIFFVYIVLAAITLAVYWQVNQFDFVNIDDDIYVIENSFIKSKINMDGFLWSLTTRYGDLWNPLVWL